MISLIHPSRGRPEQSFKNAVQWIESAGCRVELIVSLDIDDPQKHKYWKLYFGYSFYGRPFYMLGRIIEHQNQSVVEATNQAARGSANDILVYLSDDVQCFPGWGRKIVEVCSQYQGEFLIKPSDGLQKFNSDMVTIPIMSRALYQRLGYFFHPAYKSIYVDNDLYHTCKRMGWLKLHAELQFQHNHPSNGTAPNDETYIRSHAHYAQGKEVFEQRKKQNFKCD